MGVSVDFIEWQKSECIRLNITPEHHTKILDAAKKTGAVMNIPFGVAYKRILKAAKIRPTMPINATVQARLFTQD